MNKKGIIAIVAIIILVVIGFMVFGSKDTTPVVKTDETTTPTTPIPEGVDASDYAPVTKASTDTTLLGRIKKSSVGITEDGTRIALANGAAQFTVAGSNVKGTATVGDIAIEKIKGSRTDILGSVAVKIGTAATQTYVVLFADESGSLRDKSYALIGEGVTVTGLRADNVTDANIDYVVSVSYKDRDGVARTKILVVQAGLFNSEKEISL